jgi:hypothetical protein
MYGVGEKKSNRLSFRREVCDANSSVYFLPLIFQLGMVE